MTSQTVILNKLCAVASSDSSVTLAGPDGPRRTFPTAEKIFGLPSPHKILVLHSGSTELLGVPYSVLLGEWIRTLPDSPLSKVSNYREHLETWVPSQSELFTKEAQDDYLSWMLRDYFLSVRDTILRQCNEQNIDDSEWESPEAAGVVQAAISSSLAYLKRQPKMPGWEDVDCNALLKAHEAQLNDAREWVFDDTPRSSAGDAEATKLAATLLGVYEPFRLDAVLTIVGYGSDEVFPAFEKATFQGIVDGRLRAGPVDATSISTDMNVSIVPLGQTEAVHTFLGGYNPAFRDKAHERLEQLCADVKQLGKANPALTSQLDRLETEAHEALQNDFTELSWKEFVEPMINTVAGLPPAEVARMAESLVGLQVLRQLTQADAETVGGPIDVAVVTRRDGVSWIRRKSLVAPG